MPKKRGFDSEEMDYGGGSHLARRPINFDGGGRVAHSEDNNPSRMLMDSPRQKTHPGVRVPGPFTQESHELRSVDSVHSPRTPTRFADTLPASTNHDMNGANRNFYTMTGTIKRGKKKQDVVEVEVQLTQQEISKLQQSYIEDETKDNSKCGGDRGPHIVLFTIVFIPFAFLASLGYSFYIGVISWYNLYLYLSEEKTIFHKIFLCPLVILFFPIIILIAAIVIGLYGMVIQVSWYFSSWMKEMRDLEKGFYGWMFNLFGIEKCCPYEVVILDDPSTANPTMTLQEENETAAATADSQV